MEAATISLIMSAACKAEVITVLNLKGGVGKTHTSWLIASVCQERQQRVLLVDTDTQGNLTSSFFAQADGKPGVEALFHPGGEANALALVRHTGFSHIDLIPAGPSLAPFDLSNQQEWEKAELQLALVDAVSQLRTQYDYIVIDCPPRLSLVSFAALCAADFSITPMEAADWGAQGIVQVSEAIRYVQKHYNRNLHLLGYVVSRFKRARAYQKSYLQQLRQHFGDQAFDTVIPDRAEFEQSVTDRIPITLHARGSDAAGIARQFFDEVEARIKRHRRGRFTSRRTSLQRPAVAPA